ncbi:MAG: hypothetical protein CL482_10790, partial [Acidobacteria bacterium]|nr:hypothetical protein [Acidobacteriota bacterium]
DSSIRRLIQCGGLSPTATILRAYRSSGPYDAPRVARWARGVGRSTASPTWELIVTRLGDVGRADGVNIDDASGRRRSLAA